MKNIVLVLVLVSSAFNAFAQKKPYTLTATLSEDYEGPIYVTIDNEKIETKAKDRQFVLKGKLERPTQILIRTANTSCQTAFYLDTSNVAVEIEVQSKLPIPVPCLLVKNVQGSAAHEFNKKFQKEIEEAKTKSKRSVREFSTALKDVFLKHQTIDPGFPSYAQTLYQNSTLMEVEDLESVRKSFPEYLNKSVYGVAVDKKINQKKITAVGNSIPDFTQRDVNNKKLSLSSLSGKPVLIDFWASWCGPCRKENPNLVRAYQRFHEQGLEILGVSLDDDKEAWLAAIEKDGLPWKQVSDLRGWENQVAKTFFVSSIPFNILLNAEGKVVATNLTGNALHAKLAELFNTK